ncbi:ArsR/SmtB family transcription factor [Actinoplanes couchii]|uniref:ArsR/SmtB family transcription factor n=1 Tax=Actinoplanes couchii TaxID=403638 RepID=UPI0019426C42|nr:helix-turn-helix domain-containing protein [Actinoplanes couchii]MDR6317062.1 DNA-binding transcriptional ArsR family regulator [Actinoplanes couchii]
MVAASPLDQVAAEVTAAWAGHDAPPEAIVFGHDLRAGLSLPVTEIREYFAAVVVLRWPRLRAPAETEIAGRARAAVGHGARAMLDGLHPELAWTGSALELRYPHQHGRWSLDGHHLTLLPTGFAGAEVYALPDAPTGRTLWYAPRGHGMLRLPGAPQPSSAALLGSSRAAVLALVEAPYSTGEVAHRLNLSTGTASHHLTMLRDAGLVVAVRDGRRLLYQRRPLGDQLV